jgi:hypothetical protein
MVIANTAEGYTHQFDLTDDAQADALAALLRTGTITALAILHRGNQTALPLPKRFGRRQLAFGAEVLRNGTRGPDGQPAALGERVWVQAGEVRVSLLSTFTGALVRCDVVRIGRHQFDPRRDRK